MQKISSSVLRKPVVKALCAFVVAWIALLPCQGLALSQGEINIDPSNFYKVNTKFEQFLFNQMQQTDCMLRNGCFAATPVVVPAQSTPAGQLAGAPEIKPATLDLSKPLPPITVARYLVDAGFPNHAIPKMVCTAQYESNFYAQARNRNRDGTHDTGLFQINDVWLKVCRVTRVQLLNPQVNSECALRVYQLHGMKAWRAYQKRKLVCNSFRLPKQVAVY